jgi:hypothetical protein
VLAGPIVLAGIVAAAWAAGRGVAADELRILFPPDKAVVTTGTFRVIVKGGEGNLKVNGKPKKWEAFQMPIRVAEIGLSPGMHEIDIGGRKIEFAVGVEDDHEGPRDWPVVRQHVIPNDKLCTACHQTGANQGRMTLGELKSTDACFTCHKRGDVDKVHAAERPDDKPAAKPAPRTAETCQTCHVLHSSARKGLLKPSVK